MPDFITLTCPSCGGKLKVTDQIHLLACGHCGNEHMVHRDGGAIYLAPIAQDVRGIRAGVDKTAAELAVARLTKEIEALEIHRRNIEGMTNNTVLPPDFWEKLFQKAIGGTLILGILGLITSRFGFAFAMGCLFAFSLIAFVVFFETRIGNAAKMKSAKIERINADLSTKHEQYRKNRRIAEG